MSGASDATTRVTNINANWSAAGGFALLVVTEGDERFSLPASPAEVAAISTMAGNGS